MFNKIRCMSSLYKRVSPSFVLAATFGMGVATFSEERENNVQNFSSQVG